MARSINKENSWVVSVLLIVMIAYARYIFPVPSEADFIGSKDSLIPMELLVDLHVTSWVRSVVIAFVFLMAAILSLYKIRGWRVTVGIGALLVILNQKFPVLALSLLFREVTSFEQFGKRLSVFNQYPDMLSTLFIYDILMPLLCCWLLYRVFADVYKSFKSVSLTK